MGKLNLKQKTEKPSSVGATALGFCSLPVVGALIEIKQNGFYRFGERVVFAGSFGDPFFEMRCLIPPLTIDGIKQFMLLKDGRALTKSKVGNLWGDWS
jgi:hypothetical protein